MNTKPSRDFVAIDVAKDSLQVRGPNLSGKLSYDAAGLQRLLRQLQKLTHPFVVCEATGGYERPLMALRFKHRIPLSLLNPACVRAFARSKGIRAKTDPLDAQLLLRFAQERQPRPTSPPDPAREQLAALLDRRGHLTEQRAREKNRLKKSPEPILDSIGSMIALINQQLAALEAQIRSLIQHTEALRQPCQLFQLVSGVGEVTAWTLVAFLHEMDRVNRNQLVALVGIAPYNRDSGRRTQPRAIQGGRAKVRKALYMAAHTAAHHNPVIQPYVQGLLARGKPYQCALVAAMRKLLIHLQRLLKNQKKCLA